MIDLESHRELRLRKEQDDCGRAFYTCMCMMILTCLLLYIVSLLVILTVYDNEYSVSRLNVTDG
jgi:hypothetical protein